MVLKRLWIVPVAAISLIFASVIISYAIAVSDDHVSAFLPYISDIATIAPESCIFGQLINFSAFLVGLCMYWRHRQIVGFYGLSYKGDIINWRKYSVIMLFIGFLSATGMSIAANFQETKFKQMHFIGAFFTFFFGLIYLWTQAVFSYKMKPQMHPKALLYTRMAATVLATIFFFTSVTTDYFGHILSRGKHDESTIQSTMEKLHFSSHHSGYGARIVSAISSWLLSFCFCVVIVSFAYELRSAKLRPLKLVLPGSPLAEQRSEEEAAAASAIPIPDNYRDRLFTATSDNVIFRPENLPKWATELVH